MNPNLYLPPALPLMTDAELMHLKREYRAVHAEMTNEPAHSSGDRRLLGQALAAIEAELRARGIEGEPWWATPPAAERPPRRLNGPPGSRHLPSEHEP